MTHDLSRSHLQLLGLQINPLSHLHLLLFQRCLFLQTLTSNYIIYIYKSHAILYVLFH